MKDYKDDPKDNKYVIFNNNLKLTGLNNACEEIKQKTENNIPSGGICYALAAMISQAPIIDNNISMKEVAPKMV